MTSRENYKSTPKEYINELALAIDKVYQISPKNTFKSINSIKNFRYHVINLLNQKKLSSYYYSTILNASDEYIIEAAGLCDNSDIVTFSKKCEHYNWYRDYVANLLDTSNYEELYHFIYTNYRFIKDDIERQSSDSTILPRVITQVLFYDTQKLSSENAIIEILYFLCAIKNGDAIQDENQAWSLKISNESIRFFDKVLEDNKETNSPRSSLKDLFYAELEPTIRKIANYNKNIDISKMNASEFRDYITNVNFDDFQNFYAIRKTIFSVPDKALETILKRYKTEANKTKDTKLQTESPAWRKDIKKDLDYIHNYLDIHKDESSKIDRINNFFIPEYKNLLKYYAEAEQSNNTAVISALKSEINAFENTFKLYLTRTIKTLFTEEQSQASVSNKVAEQIFQMDFGDTCFK